jgi:hypothetical protein
MGMCQAVDAMLQELVRSWLGVSTIAAEVIALVGMAPHLLVEIYSIKTYKWSWFSAWNMVDILTYVNQVRMRKILKPLHRVPACVYDLGCKLLHHSRVIFVLSHDLVVSYHSCLSCFLADSLLSGVLLYAGFCCMSVSFMSYQDVCLIVSHGVMCIRSG